MSEMEAIAEVCKGVCSKMRCEILSRNPKSEITEKTEN
jgi:hypothetical protein